MPVDKGKAITLSEGATPSIGPTILAARSHWHFSWERGQSESTADQERPELDLEEDHYQTQQRVVQSAYTNKENILEEKIDLPREKGSVSLTLGWMKTKWASNPNFRMGVRVKK